MTLVLKVDSPYLLDIFKKNLSTAWVVEVGKKELYVQAISLQNKYDSINVIFFMIKYSYIE